MKPTKLADAPKVGDVVRVLGGNMLGTVLRVVKTGSVPYATVQWTNSVGRHTVTTLEVIKL